MHGMKNKIRHIGLFTWNNDSHRMDWWIFMKCCIGGPLLNLPSKLRGAG
jgi:hypothetical protein